MTLREVTFVAGELVGESFFESFCFRPGAKDLCKVGSPAYSMAGPERPDQGDTRAPSLRPPDHFECGAWPDQGENKLLPIAGARPPAPNPAPDPRAGLGSAASPSPNAGPAPSSARPNLGSPPYTNTECPAGPAVPTRPGPDPAQASARYASILDLLGARARALPTFMSQRCGRAPRL